MRGKEFFIGVVALGIAVELSNYAFSLQSRNKIRDRARSKLGYVGSEVSGVPEWEEHMEAAHIDHSRDNPDYDNPENGVLMTVAEHLVDHIEREGRNGLSRRHNLEAIQSLKQRVVKYYGEDYLYELLAPRVEKV